MSLCKQCHVLLTIYQGRELWINPEFTWEGEGLHGPLGGGHCMLRRYIDLNV